MQFSWRQAHNAGTEGLLQTVYFITCIWLRPVEKYEPRPGRRLNRQVHYFHSTQVFNPVTDVA
jgi:hypothetical protein